MRGDEGGHRLRGRLRARDPAAIKVLRSLAASVIALAAREERLRLATALVGILAMYVTFGLALSAIGRIDRSSRV